MKEIESQLEWAQATLDDAIDLKGEDIAVTVGDQSYTKKQLREYQRKLERDQKKYLPDVARRLATADEAKRVRTMVDGQIRKEMPWVDNKDDERTKQLAAMIADPRLKRIEEVEPGVAAQLPYFLAHSVNSMYGRRSIPLTDAPKKEEPPDNPSGGAAASRAPESIQTRNTKDLEAKFHETGNPNDWVNLRAARMGQRRSIK